MLVKQWWGDFLEWLFGIEYEPYEGYKEDKKEYEGLPYGSWHCEILGICRRKKEEGWKCYRGCMILNAERERNKKEQDKIAPTTQY